MCDLEKSMYFPEGKRGMKCKNSDGSVKKTHKSRIKVLFFSDFHIFEKRTFVSL